jgi:tripartite-type tricarboxylate transporter receptor subunit TctC
MIKKFLIAALSFAVTGAMAFTSPNVVTTTVGYAPGSGNEVSFRIVSSIVEKTNPGTSYIISNKPGAGETVGLNWFVKQPLDGSNLFIASQQGVFTATEIWYPDQAQYNPMDLAFVTTIAKSPLCVVANINSRTNTPQELIKRLRDTKEPVNFAIGAPAHKLVFEYLLDKGNGNKDQVLSVLYKGPAQAVQDVAGNQVEFGIMPTAIAYPLVKAGKVKYIALAGEQRLAQIPDVPLWKDTIPGLNVYAAWVIVMPPGTPRDQIEYYNKLFVPAINSPEAKKIFDDNLMYAVKSEQTPEGVRKYLDSIRTQWMPYFRKIPLQ